MFQYYVLTSARTSDSVGLGFSSVWSFPSWKAFEGFAYDWNTYCRNDAPAQISNNSLHRFHAAQHDPIHHAPFSRIAAVLSKACAKTCRKVHACIELVANCYNNCSPCLALMCGHGNAPISV